MKVLRRYYFACKIAFVILAVSPVIGPAWAHENGTKSARQLAIKVSSKNLESPKRAIQPSSILIEHVQATGVDQQVQVRITGSGDLSCVPFRLDDPDRLVLDCSGARVRVQQLPIRGGLDPVRAVRFGQFKTDVARVVIDLEGQPPYTIQAGGNIVTVVFDSIRRQSSGLKSANKQVEPASRSVKKKVEQATSTDNLLVQDLPLPRYPDSALASLIHAETLPPQDRFVSAWLPPPPAPVVSSDLPRVQEARSGVGTPTEKLDSTPFDQDYVIGPQDVLAINVWHEPELSQSVPVRPDGKISLPLVGDLEVTGLTPRLLQARLAKELDAYIRKPRVTVVVHEVNSHKFYILGEVEHPGAYALATRMTVLDALATAGGFRDFAKVKQMYLLRLMPDGSRKRIRFDFKAAVNGKNSYRDIELQPGDTLVVP